MNFGKGQRVRGPRRYERVHDFVGYGPRLDWAAPDFRRRRLQFGMYIVLEGQDQSESELANGFNLAVNDSHRNLLLRMYVKYTWYIPVWEERVDPLFESGDVCASSSWALDGHVWA